jgi:lysophospholipase L1-like esterase
MMSSSLLRLLPLILLASFAATASAEPTPAEMLKDAKRVLFLGDSITAAGGYVAYFDAWLASERGENAPLVINAGLPSETVSGLSEEGHADGKFPRPDLAERLDRVLKLAKPDLVIACYGINCGIYEPFDDARFQRYQQGQQHLRTEVEKAGAKLIIVTPPFYDDLRSPRKFSYNEVLDKYSQWLVDERNAGWIVIDLHSPMTKEVVKRRQQNPQFTFQPDGVHPNAAGQWFVAQQLIKAFGDEEAAKAESPEQMLAVQKAPASILPLVEQRMKLLRDAYVATAGHKRPGVAKGLPLDAAQEQAAALSARIREALAAAK